MAGCGMTHVEMKVALEVANFELDAQGLRNAPQVDATRCP